MTQEEPYIEHYTRSASFASCRKLVGPLDEKRFTDAAAKVDRLFRNEVSSHRGLMTYLFNCLLQKQGGLELSYALDIASPDDYESILLEQGVMNIVFMLYLHKETGTTSVWFYYDNRTKEELALFAVRQMPELLFIERELFVDYPVIEATYPGWEAAIASAQTLYDYESERKCMFLEWFETRQHHHPVVLPEDVDFTE